MHEKLFNKHRRLILKKLKVRFVSKDRLVVCDHVEKQFSEGFAIRRYGLLIEKIRAHSLV